MNHSLHEIRFSSIHLFIILNLKQDFILLLGDRLHDFEIGLSNLSPDVITPNSNNFHQQCYKYTGNYLPHKSTLVVINTKPFLEHL